MRTIWKLIVEAYDQFIDDKGFKMAAALSYYAAFSLGPLLIIVIAIAGFFFGEEAVHGQIVTEMGSLVGHDGAEMVQNIIKGAADKTTGIFATIFSVILLILGSVGVFLELQESLNILWGVELRPGRGIWGFIKNRLVSFSMVVGASFILMISLLVNSAIRLLSNYLGNHFDWLLPLIDILNIIASFFIIALLFALIFKYLPDVIIPWSFIWLGAFLTSALFSIGKYLIGIYLGNSSYSSTYGAAASLVVLFIWVYYSGLIVFFGTELTQLYYKKFSSVELKPDRDGILVKKVSDLIKEAAEEKVKEEKKKAAEKARS